MPAYILVLAIAAVHLSASSSFGFDFCHENYEDIERFFNKKKAARESKLSDLATEPEPGNFGAASMEEGGQTLQGILDRVAILETKEKRKYGGDDPAGRRESELRAKQKGQERLVAELTELSKRQPEFFGKYFGKTALQSGKLTYEDVFHMQAAIQSQAKLAASMEKLHEKYLAAETPKAGNRFAVAPDLSGGGIRKVPPEILAECRKLLKETSVTPFHKDLERYLRSIEQTYNGYGPGVDLFTFQKLLKDVVQVRAY